MLDTTPHTHTAGFPFHSTSPPAWIEVPSGRLGSSIVPCPGFPFRASLSVYPASVFSLRQEPMGPPKFFDVSLPACHGLWTPADLHILAKSDDLVLPSVSVKTLGIRNKPFRSCTSTSGYAATPTAYRILCLRFTCLVRQRPVDSATGARLDTGGWLALTRQGLSPCKIRQAFLGAVTLGVRRGGGAERNRRRLHALVRQSFGLLNLYPVQWCKIVLFSNLFF